MTACETTKTVKGCGREWTALGEAHCTRCHLHFANIKAFDQHQVELTGKKNRVGDTRCLSETEIPQQVTEHKTRESHPTFLIREDGTITLFDPYRDERLQTMATTTKSKSTKSTAKGKTTKATAKPKAEKRVCAEDGCKRVLKKKPGRGRWPVRCQKHGGTGLV